MYGHGKVIELMISTVADLLRSEAKALFETND